MLYPFFGTMLGWLGVALTGSDTASNVLFGGLQKITAEQLGLSPILMAAANSSGGVMGKMIDAQSIVVASTATRWYGHEGDILRYVFLHSIVLAALVGLLVTLQAYVPPFTDAGDRAASARSVSGRNRHRQKSPPYGGLFLFAVSRIKSEPGVSATAFIDRRSRPFSSASSTFTRTDWPSFRWSATLFTRSSAICEMCSRPSLPGSTLTMAPKSSSLSTVPS